MKAEDSKSLDELLIKVETKCDEVENQLDRIIDKLEKVKKLPGQ